jgi:hypothetical protein
MSDFSDVIKAVEDDLLRADLEWRLQFSQKLGCECSTYMMVNRERVVPSLILHAASNNEDPEDVVARFVKNLHQRHLEGLSIFR